MSTHIIEDLEQLAEPVRRHRWTVAAYHRLGETGILTEDDRIELIDGELLEMAPIGSPHADVVDRLAEWLILRAGGQYRIRVQNPIQMNDYSEPEPDIAVVRKRSYADAHPQAADVLLLIEVARTTLVYDRDVKIPLYARAGIAEVWLVDVANRRIEIHREPGPEGYRHIVRPGRDETLVPLKAPELAVGVAEVF